MLVDDDSVVRRVVARQLQVLGWHVVAVETGEEAVNAVNGGLQADLLLSDIQLPGIDGLAVGCAVRSVSPRTRIAYMSGATRPVQIQPVEAPFLQKPFSLDHLAGAIGSLSE